MNVRDQTSQAIVTSSGPLGDRTSKFVSQTKKKQVSQYGPNADISEQFVSKQQAIL